MLASAVTHRVQRALGMPHDGELVARGVLEVSLHDAAALVDVAHHAHHAELRHEAAEG
ncbi:MAG: hypothetical protein QNK04_15345 [Myxococcota bacterium]|nr:hypothetical protein [Myxococcota bacterium]